MQGVVRGIVTNLPRRALAGCYYLEDGISRVNEVLVRTNVCSSRGLDLGEYLGILFRGPLRAFQPGSSVNSMQCQGLSGLLGGKEARGEEPREESGQLVYKPGGHTWKGAEAGRGARRAEDQPRRHQS